MPHIVGDNIYPIDKTNLDVLRILHFFSLAVITVNVRAARLAGSANDVGRPAIICGQHSLAIFCLGVFLAFAGHFVFTEVSNRLLTQIIVSIAGIAIMVAFAALITWYKSVEDGDRAATACGQAGLRWGRRMRRRLLILLALRLRWLTVPAAAEHPYECRVSDELITSDFALPHVAAAIAAKQLDVLVVGAGSSTLPGPAGPKVAYPARLQRR